MYLLPRVQRGGSSTFLSILVRPNSNCHQLRFVHHRFLTLHNSDKSHMRFYRLSHRKLRCDYWWPLRNSLSDSQDSSKWHILLRCRKHGPKHQHSCIYSKHRDLLLNLLGCSGFWWCYSSWPNSFHDHLASFTRWWCYSADLHNRFDQARPLPNLCKVPSWLSYGNGTLPGCHYKCHILRCCRFEQSWRHWRVIHGGWWPTLNRLIKFYIFPFWL